VEKAKTSEMNIINMTTSLATGSGVGGESKASENEELELESVGEDDEQELDVFVNDIVV